MTTRRLRVPIFDLPGTNPLIGGLTVASIHFTRKGAQTGDASGALSWLGGMDSLIFALGSGISLFLLWTAGPYLVAKLETVRERLIGSVLIGVSTVMIATVSTIFAAAGTGGDEARRTHMNRSMAPFEEAMDCRYQSLTGLNSFVDDLDRQASLFLTRRDSELNNGAYTGRPGPGTVTELLGSLSGQFTSLGNQLRGRLSERLAGTSQIAMSLEAMRTYANQSGDPSAAMNEFAREADSLRAGLNDIDIVPIVESVVRGLRALPGEVRLQTVTAKSTKIAKRQRAALERVATETTQSVETLVADLQGLIGACDTAPGFERVNSVEAMLRYPVEHLPYWGGAIAIDFTPTLLLIYAMTILYVRGKRGQFVDTVAELTVKDIQVAMTARDAIRSIHADPSVIDEVLTGDSNTARENGSSGTDLAKGGDSQ